MIVHIHSMEIRAQILPLKSQLYFIGLFIYTTHVIGDILS